MTKEYFFRQHLPDEEFVRYIKWKQQNETERGHVKSQVSIFAHEFALEGRAGFLDIIWELDKTIIAKQSRGIKASDQETNTVFDSGGLMENITRIVLGNSIVYLETALVDKYFYYSEFLGSINNMTSGRWIFKNPYKHVTTEDIRSKWSLINYVSKEDLTFANLFRKERTLPVTLHSFIAANNLFPKIWKSLRDDYEKYAKQLILES